MQVSLSILVLKNIIIRKMQPIKIFNYTPVTRLRFKSLHANH